MQKGNLTREQAIEIVGADAVISVEAKNCDFTNRVVDGGMVEFAASVVTSEGVLTAYYYTSQDEIDTAGDDLSNVDWTISGYEVV
mgnify:CR=1 FL=1